MRRGNESLFGVSGSNDKDGRQAHILAHLSRRLKCELMVLPVELSSVYLSLSVCL